MSLQIARLMADALDRGLPPPARCPECDLGRCRDRLTACRVCRLERLVMRVVQPRGVMPAPTHVAYLFANSLLGLVPVITSLTVACAATPRPEVACRRRRLS